MNEPDCANPQLLAWVKEWLDLARERNSKGITTYKHAYDSLKACPIVMQHPAELQKLKGFGPKLCERLEDKLKKHCQEQGLPMPEHPQARRAAQRAQSNAGQEGGEASNPAKKPRKPKAYVPAFRSGAYALVIGLSSLSEDAPVGMTKAELIEVAQNYCDSSFTAPSDTTKFYTAWNSMKTLLQKELVYERGRPLRRYSLTDEGWDVAKRIMETPQWQAENRETDLWATTTSSILHARARSEQQQQEDEEGGEEGTSAPDAVQAHITASPYQNVVVDGPLGTIEGSLPTFTPITLPPGSFTVQLVLDVREVRAKTDRDYMQEELAKLGVKPIMRSLELGDAQWVAKCHDPTLLSRNGSEGDEIVLDWIVERKRLDDLIGSIKDGRFHEQKFRLKRSGVRKVIYIIEDMAMDPGMYQRYEEAVQSAIASTQVCNGYFVKRTTKMDETIKYLSRLTLLLKRTHECKPLMVVPTKVLTAQNYLPLLNQLRGQDASLSYHISYPAFASMASKSEMMTLRDVFLKMLMATRGITGERALEMQKKWKTPNDFVKAFEACGTGQFGKKRKIELVSSQMSHLVGRKKVTRALSHKIAEVWGDV